MEIEVSETLVFVERRRHLALRAAFDDVYPRIEPLLDSTRTWGGTALTTFVYRVVRERCPDLSPEQAQILVAAAQRVHRERRRPGAKPKAAVALPAVPA